MSADELLERDDMQRFFDKVEVGDCWQWVGARNGGYGYFWADGGTVSAHRWLYLQLMGHPGGDLELDHLCRNRACVNPDHLEPVTHAENLARSPFFLGKRCRRGHVRTPESVYTRPNGYVVCRPCRKLRRRSRQTQKAAA